MPGWRSQPVLSLWLLFWIASECYIHISFVNMDMINCNLIRWNSFRIIFMGSMYQINNKGWHAIGNSFRINFDYQSRNHIATFNIDLGLQLRWKCFTNDIYFPLLDMNHFPNILINSMGSRSSFTQRKSSIYWRFESLFMFYLYSEVITTTDEGN